MFLAGDLEIGFLGVLRMNTDFKELRVWWFELQAGPAALFLGLSFSLKE